MARAGLGKVVNFQDLAYGEEYLQLLSQVVATDRQNGGETQAYRLSSMAAKYLANAMAYDDVIRVADLKTHADRYDRIAKEVGAGSDQILSTTEYMHPRMEELAGLLPAKLALWLKSKDGLYQWLDRRVNKGRRVQTYTLGSFLMLYILGGLRSTRRASLRHAEEVAHRDAWLEYALDMAAKNYDLAVEILQIQRLIKGYSDTHSRGLSKFDRVMAEIQLISHRPDAADWARRLRETAVKDGEDVKLNGLIQTMQSFD
jgi:indolepyruvate ferredoxin oxidoreductase beta subunit